METKKTTYRLLKLAEAAEMTNLSVSTWRAWVLRGRIPVVRLGRAVRIRESDVVSLIESGLTPAKEGGRS